MGKNDRQSGSLFRSVTVPIGLGTSASIAISVIAEDQVSTKTYTINVNRPSR
ncbi:MAG: hypothetical protein HC938_10690 [Nitrospira sp.]|nr:hypothetical protein [Nitrospira sp.]